MPSNVVDSDKDEEKWQKAKRLAKEQGHEEEYDYIMGIYKKMDPEGIDKESSCGLIKKTASQYEKLGDRPRESPLSLYAHNALLNKRKGLDPEHPFEELDEDALVRMVQQAPEDRRGTYESNLREFTGRGLELPEQEGGDIEKTSSVGHGLASVKKTA